MPVTVIAAAAGYNFAAHPEVNKGHTLPWVLSLIGCLVLLGAGAAVIIGLSGEGGPAGKSATNFCVFLIVTGLAGGLAWLVAGFFHVTRPQREAYRQWKKTLTPEQLAAVRIAEWAATFAVLEGAHIAIRHSNERMDARHAARQALHERRRQEHQERTARVEAMQDAAAGHGLAIWQQGPQPRMWQQP